MISPAPTTEPAPRASWARAWRLGGVVVGLAVLLHALLWLALPTRRELVSDLFSVLAFVFTTGSLWAASRHSLGRPRLAWGALALAATLVAVCNGWWFGVHAIYGVQVEPFPLTDALLMSAAAAHVVGVVAFPVRRGSFGERLAEHMDITVIALGAGLLVGSVFYVEDGTGSMSWLSLLLVALFVGLLLNIVVRPLEGQARAPLLWYLAGLALPSVDIVSYSVRTPDVYDTSQFTVIFTVAGGWLMGLAGLRQLAPDAGRPEPIPPWVGKTLQALPYAIVAAACVAIVGDSGDLPHRVVEVGAVALIGVMSLRQILVLRENGALARRLIEANAHLEARIAQRTLALEQANAGLTRQIQERTRIEHALSERERRLIEVALRDNLTGLPNRAALLQRLEEVVAEAKEAGDARFAVLFLDLDGFKVINDSLGHRVGDLFLVEIARRLERAVRGRDTVARIGGDEFVCLLTDVGEPDAVAAGARLQEALARPVDIDGHRVHTSASIGVALGRTDLTDVAEIVRDADLAMYAAKGQGKARQAVYSAELHTAALTRLTLETDLRAAIDGGELHLAYQPIHALTSGRLVGFEALIRWNHPERGPVSPAEFIPVAESTGMILPMGRQVLREACGALARWREDYGVPALTVSVNLSTRQFADRELPDLVAATLAETGLPAACLKLEITESALIDDAETALLMFRRLRELGVKLELDDFGTGYSSLSYLHRFPFDALKIDRSFVARLEDDVEIIRTIVTLAHALGLSVTAEGVETELQLERLRALQCDLAQGWHFYRPLSPDRVARLLEARRNPYLRPEAVWTNAGRPRRSPTSG